MASSLTTTPLTKPKPSSLSSRSYHTTRPNSKVILNLSYHNAKPDQSNTKQRLLNASLFGNLNRSEKRNVVVRANGVSIEAKEPEPEVGSYRRILLSDVVVQRKRNVFLGRRWNSLDIGTAGVVLAMHLLSLFAPFQFNWSAFWVAFGLYVVTGLLGITLSFHRNLSHKSFKLPKWLEYCFAYCGVQALQVSCPSEF